MSALPLPPTHFSYLFLASFYIVDLSSWEQKIQRDAVAEKLDVERPDDGTESVLVEHQSDSAMEMSSPSQELYKDGVLTLGCIGRLHFCLQTISCRDRFFTKKKKKKK